MANATYYKHKNTGQWGYRFTGNYFVNGIDGTELDPRYCERQIASIVPALVKTGVKFIRWGLPVTKEQKNAGRGIKPLDPWGIPNTAPVNPNTLTVPVGIMHDILNEIRKINSSIQEFVRFETIR